MQIEPAYDYQFQDRSLVLRVIKRPVLEPLVAMLPRRLSPNTITLTGHAVVWIAMGWLLTAARIGAPLLIFLAVAHVLYAIADCVDGMFARATQQASRLGEMLDHWLDAITVPLVPLIFGLALQQPGGLIIASTMVTALMHFITFDHGYRLGYVRLGPFGVIEMCLIVAAVFGVAAGVGVECLNHPWLAGFSFPGMLMVCVILGGLGELFFLRQLCRWPGDFVTPVVLLLELWVWFHFGHLAVSIAGLLIVAVVVAHEGRVIAARLLQSAFLRWNLALVLVLGVAAGVSLRLDLSPQGHNRVVVMVIVYAVIIGTRDFWRTLRSVRTAKVVPAPSAVAV